MPLRDFREDCSVHVPQLVKNTTKGDWCICRGAYLHNCAYSNDYCVRLLLKNMPTCAGPLHVFGGWPVRRGHLSGRRLRCELRGRSRRWSPCTSPRTGRGSGTGPRSCCSVPGSLAARRGWSSPAPPGPASSRSAAGSGCSPGNPSASMLCPLRKIVNPDQAKQISG